MKHFIHWLLFFYYSHIAILKLYLILESFHPSNKGENVHIVHIYMLHVKLFLFAVVSSQ